MPKPRSPPTSNLFHSLLLESFRWMQIRINVPKSSMILHCLNNQLGDPPQASLNLCVQCGLLPPCSFFFLIFYLFYVDSYRERERERGRDTGRGRSRLHAPGARRGIRSRVSRIAPWGQRQAPNRCATQGSPLFFIINLKLFIEGILHLTNKILVSGPFDVLSLHKSSSPLLYWSRYSSQID